MKYLIKVLIIVLGFSVLTQIASTTEVQHSVDDLKRLKYSEAKLLLNDVLDYFLVKDVNIEYDDAYQNELKRKVKLIIEGVEGYLEENKDNEHVYYDLGMAYFAAKKLELLDTFEKSNINYIEAIKIKPSFAEARILLARNYMEEKAYEKALAQSEYMYEHDLKEDALKMVAVAKIHMRKFDEAKADLQEFLKKNPNDKSSKALIYAINTGKIEEHLKKKR